MRGQDSSGSIQLIKHDLVQTEIARQNQAVVWIPSDEMGVRAFLALGVNTRPVMLDGAAWLADATIALDGQHRDAPTAVIGHQNAPAVWVHGQVTRAAAAGRSLIKKRQVPGLLIQLKRADSSKFSVAKIVYLV